ncbi:MAG TPA: tetratricopeptide repeat protein, partial [Ktedonobacteraceae bacterium]|nr:tetratricopeptide repeat protein [Ktedonobacteraceae bacterium]
RVRSYLVSRISIPEGLALLQQRGVQGSPEELSLVWQRCTGQVFALVLFGALLKLSGISLSYLLNSPDYQPAWAGDVTTNFIASIYNFLKPAQLAIIRALSLFMEPVPLEGIMMLIAGNGAITPPIGIDTASYAPFEREIYLLTQLGLVQTLSNTASISCYILHPLLRRYVLEHYLEGGKHSSANGLSPIGISASSEQSNTSTEALNVALAAGHMKVASYYKHVIHQRCPPREQRQTVQDLEPIVSVIRHLCLAWRWQQACTLLFEEGLHESLAQLGAWSTLIGLYAALLPPFGSLGKREEGMVISQVGMLCGRIGDYQYGIAYLEQALAIQRQIADQSGEAITLAHQGELLRMQGEYERARKSFEQAMMLNKQQNLALQCVILYNLGLIYQHERDYGRALSCYSEALKLSYKLPGQYDKGVILTDLGLLLYEQGQPQEALAILLAALKLRQMLRDPGVSPLLHFLNTLEQKMGAGAYALACQHALEMQRQVFSRFVP